MTSQKQLVAVFGVFAVVMAAFAGLTMIGEDSSAETFSFGLLYDANGGTGAPTQTGVDVSSTSYTFTVSSVKPEYSGHTFLGWSLSSSATSASYVGGNSITVTTDDDQNNLGYYKTLYAVWSASSSSGGSSGGSSGSTSSEDDLNFTSPTAVESVSGSSISYKATVNIANSTFTKSGGTASWLSITTSGLLTGTAPSVSSMTSYTFIIKATSPGGQTATQTVTFDVYPVAKLTASASSVSAKVGTKISDVSVTSNLVCSFSYSNVSGTFSSSGLTFNTSTGKITGTPTTVGTYTIKVQGTTTVGPSQSPSVQITFVVGEKDLSITSNPPTGIYKVGSQWTYTPVANQTVTWSLVDAPTWLGITSDNKVSGQVTGYSSATNVTFGLKATTSAGQYAIQNITISVEPGLAFTSVPTASCSVIPVYTYAPDGSFSISLASLAFAVGCNMSATAPVALGADASETSDGSASTDDGTEEAASDGVSDSTDYFSTEDSGPDSGSGSDGTTVVPVTGDDVAPSISVTDTRTFKFVWTGEYAESVLWDFGDGETATGFTVVHSYQKDGVYTYTCTGINSIGQSTIKGTITVANGDVSVYDVSMIVGIILFLLIVGAVIYYHRKGKANYSVGSKRTSKKASKSSNRRH